MSHVAPSFAQETRPMQSTGIAAPPSRPAQPEPVQPAAQPQPQTDSAACERCVRSFQHTAPGLRPELARLAERAVARQLFITCADSRLSQCDHPQRPRRAVPSATSAWSRLVSAAIAVDISGAEQSPCRALRLRRDQSLLHGAHRRDGMGAPAHPLAAARPGLAPGAPARSGRHRPRTARRDALERLCLTNVVQQLDNLRGHPSVPGIAAGALRLTGLYFDLAAAQTYLLCANGSTFSPVRPQLESAA
ncbi:hypothetical protein GXW82_30580 [Streptacidiphilus sp. 4-A2]|nr:hypothetical protein [Streptacidiphilus sp. 4-A2]